MGGEEFLVVSRYVDRRGTAILAERIRAEINQHRFDIGHGVIVDLTCSIGFASFPLVEERPTDYTWQEVVSVSDRMLYLAKEIGRNSWVGVSKALGKPGDDIP